MNIGQTITLGQILTIGVPLVSAIAAAVGGWFMTRIMSKTKTAVVAEVKEVLEKHSESVDTKIADTNRRVSDLAAVTVQTSTELREFKEHVARHFVKKRRNRRPPRQRRPDARSHASEPRHRDGHDG